MQKNKTSKKAENVDERAIAFPTQEEIDKAIAGVKNADDFFGKDGIMAKLFAKSMQQIFEAELTNSLGYQKNEIKNGLTTNSRNGYYGKKVKSSFGDVTLDIPRDRDGEYEPQIIKKHQKSTNEIENKIIALYGRGMTVRDISKTLEDAYGLEISDSMISTVTDKLLPMIHEW